MKESLEGIVIEVDEKISRVKINKHGDCCSCGACLGENAVILNASNVIGARIGQHVMVEIENRNLLKAAFFVYILPMLMVLTGVLLGIAMSHLLRISAVLLSCISGLIFFIFAALAIKKVNDSFQSSKEEIRIIKIID